MLRTRFTMATLLTATLGLAACGGGSDPLATPAGDAAAPSSTIVVGSADFAENNLLAEIYAGALEAKKVKVEKKLNIGSRETYIPGLEDGSIDLIPEYSGVLLQYFKKGATEVSAAEVYSALPGSLPPALEVLEQSAAEDKDAVVVTKQTAATYKLASIADLKAVAGRLVLGGPPEWKTRETGVPGLKAKYGVVFKKFTSLDAGGPLSINALKSGRVQAANIFSTDPNISANDWVVLEDPNNLFAAQNVLPLINKKKASATVTAALNAVSAKLTTPVLTGLVKQVVLDKADPQTVAKTFLSSNGLS